MLGRKSLDNAHAAQRLLELCHCFAPLVLCVEALVFELAPDAPHEPAHERQHDDGEQRELPRGVDEHPKVASEQNGVFDEHVERAGNRVLNLVDIAAHACNDVALALVAEKGQWQRHDFVIHLGADVAHNAGAQRHHYSHRGKVAARFEQCGRHQKQANEQQCRGGAILVHQLGGVPIHIVYGNVLDAHAGG